MLIKGDATENNWLSNRNIYNFLGLESSQYLVEDKAYFRYYSF